MAGCEEEKLANPAILEEITEEAYIIGVDPCSFPIGDSGAVEPLDGFVLRLVESKDTVVTYNLPNGIVEIVHSLENNYLFSKEMRESLNLTITYRKTTKEEEYFPLCLANVSVAEYSSAVGGRQVVVINAERID